MNDTESTEQDPQQDPQQQEPQDPQQRDTSEPVVANLMKQVESLRHEAAQYRTERNSARELLAAARRLIVTTAEPVGYLLNPDAVNDVLNDGLVDVDGMFTETGELDTDALTDRLRELIREKPYLRNASLSDGKGAMRSALANHAPRVRPVAHDPLRDALMKR